MSWSWPTGDRLVAVCACLSASLSLKSACAFQLALESEATEPIVLSLPDDWLICKYRANHSLSKKPVRGREGKSMKVRERERERERAKNSTKGRAKSKGSSRRSSRRRRRRSVDVKESRQSTLWGIEARKLPGNVRTRVLARHQQLHLQPNSRSSITSSININTGCCRKSSLRGVFEGIAMMRQLVTLSLHSLSRIESCCGSGGGCCCGKWQMASHRVTKLQLLPKSLSHRRLTAWSKEKQALDCEGDS